jgi:enhancing lycopene biosynthesis protein 2
MDMWTDRLKSFLTPGGYEGKKPTKRVAFILAGCGARDGTEITEAVAALIALSQEEFSVSLFAPNRDSHHLVNHFSGQDVVGSRRNMLEEANRIGRGTVRPLEDLRWSDYDALVFSGGFGVAKNLCDYAFHGPDASVFPDVKEIILSFLNNKKPVAAMCIAPVLLGMVARDLGLKGVRLTLGDGSLRDVANLAAWGCEQVNCSSGEVCVDEVHKFVTVPAYMIGGASPADIFACGKAMVAGLQRLLA